MIKKIILFSIILILGLTPFIFAETNTVDVDDIFPLGEIRYVKPCFFNGTYCSASAQCNLTVFFPNNTQLLNTGIMTNNITEHNITFTSNTLGIHKADQVCSDQGFSGSNTFYFDVTATGDILSTAEGIIYIIFLVAIISIFSLCLWGAIRIPFKNQVSPSGEIITINDMKYFKVFLIVMSYILLMFIFGVTRSIMANYLFINGASAVFNYLFWIMFSFMFPLLIASLVFTVVIFLNSKKLKEALERGIPIR